MTVCAIDLTGRLFVIEKDVAAPWIACKPSIEAGAIAGGDAVVAENRRRSQLSVLTVIIKLSRSKRAFAALVNVLLYGIFLSTMEPTLSLRLQNVYGYTSLKVGIVYVVADIPTIFATAIAGWIADRMGPRWMTLLCLIAGIPWWIVMAFRGKIALFVTGFALASESLAGGTVLRLIRCRFLPCCGYYPSLSGISCSCAGDGWNRIPSRLWCNQFHIRCFQLVRTGDRWTDLYTHKAWMDGVDGYKCRLDAFCCIRCSIRNRLWRRFVECVKRHA